MDMPVAAMSVDSDGWKRVGITPVSESANVAMVSASKRDSGGRLLALTARSNSNRLGMALISSPEGVFGLVSCFGTALMGAMWRVGQLH